MVTGVFELPKDLQLDAPATNNEWFVSGAENWMVYEVFRVIAGQRHDKAFAHLAPIVMGGPSGSGKSLLGRLLADIWTQRGLSTQIFSAADWIRTGLRSRPTSRDGNDKPAPCAPSVPTSASRFVLDDVHQLVGYESAQRRLVSYLDALASAEGIAVVTTQTSLHCGLQLSPALISRLRAGTTIQLSLPDKPSRWMIIQKLAMQLGWTLDGDAMEAVDRNLPVDPRLLSGRLRQLLPQRPFQDPPLPLRDIKLRLGADGQSSVIMPDQIINEVARQLQIPARLIRSQSRRKNVVQGRSIAIYLLRKLTNLPLKAIGNLFSNRDHATILHAIQKIESALPHDLQLTRLIDDLQLLLQTGSGTKHVDLH